MIKSKRTAEAYWVENRKRWQINVQRDGERKTFTCSEKGRAGKRECEAKADKWLCTFNTEQNFGFALYSYLEFKKERVSEGSYSTLEYCLKKHCCSSIPEAKKLSAISINDWQKIIDRIITGGGSESNAMKIRQMILAFIQYCDSRNWEIIVPKEGQLDIPKGGKAKKVKQALDSAQVRSLLALDGAELFQFALLTGLRRGELIGLQWQDISNGILTINRAMERGIETKGKTENAQRKIPLQPDALKILNRLKAEYIKEGRLCKWVFPSDRGAVPMSESSVDWQWKKVAKAIGAEGFTLHELRHTFISIVKADMELSQLKLIVGHSESMDTCGIYGHVTDRDLMQTRVAVTDAFNDYRSISESKVDKA